ncbi:MAG TPA: hypothetical protein VFK76_00325 [Gaiellaceae bacterium]|nr:hypothetical protein [Gaiellaceae bacterium]
MLLKARFAATIVGLSIAALFSASVGGAAVVQHLTLPSSFTFFDACTGESVLVSGNVKLLVTSTVNDNTVSGMLHSEFKATGVGLDSGLPYQEEVTANFSFQSSLQNGEATATSVGRITVVAPGPGNNLVSPLFVHSTFDANGNLTSFKQDSTTVPCR